MAVKFLDAWIVCLKSKTYAVKYINYEKFQNEKKLESFSEGYTKIIRLEENHNGLNGKKGK